MANDTNLLNLTDAALAAGVSRKTLYRHIDAGELSVTRQNGKRFIDVSELIRKYGNVSLPDKKKQRDTVTDDTQIPALTALSKEIQELRAQMTLLLEDKDRRQAELEQREADKQQLTDQQKRIEDLTKELEAERSKSVWARIFGSKKF